MRNKLLLGLLILTCLFIITGCESKEKDKEVEIKNVNKVKTKLSCYHDTYLWHSKKSVEHILSLDKNNKLVGYEYIEKYYEFDETGGDFNIICEGAPEEAENNNKLYSYLKETANCNEDSMEVTISDLFDISKLESKKQLKSDELKDSLDDDYIVDIEKFKNSIAEKGYTCAEK